MVTESLPVAVGDVLAGKLAVERILGRGGMGVVMAARHLHLDERVAVKLLLPEIASSEEFAERFMREARAAVRIKSEHVARIMDVGMLEQGLPYIVMEYLEGEDLESVIASHGPLPVEQAVDFVLQACEAIAEAHAAGIVHRDLKPSNLFRTQRPDGSPLIKVLDFGISKNVGGLGAAPEQGALTKTGGLMGSPAYMSPEQVRSTKAVDARTDIWSLGVILYELLVGRPPFAGENVGGLLASILEDQPTPIWEHRIDVPRPLALAVQRSLEKDPAKRPQTIGEFVASVTAFGSETGKLAATRIHRYFARDSAASLIVVEPTDLERASQDAPTLAQTAVAVPHPAASVPSSRRWWVLGAGALVVGSVIVFVLLRVAQSPEGSEPIVPPAEPATAPPSATASAVAVVPEPVPYASADAIIDAGVPDSIASAEPPRRRNTTSAGDNKAPSTAKTVPTSTSKGGLDGLIDERR